MKLLWLRYGKEHKYGLFLYIGQSTNKLIVLKTSEIADNDRNIIKANAELLGNMKSEDRYNWLKEHCKSVRKAYRTLDNKLVSILNEYSIDKTE